MKSMSFKSICLVTLLLLVATCSSAFVVKPQSQMAKPFVSNTSAESSMARYIFNKNKKQDEDDDDLSFIESRDMTRKEMEEYNKSTERVMNTELWAMTLFSLVLSVPMFYLVWVGFFADTAGVDESLGITY